MSIKLMNKVWSSSVPSNLKLTLLALADWASENGKCWPSIPTIAIKAGKSLRQVQYDLKELEGLSLLKKAPRINNTTVYWLNTRPELIFPEIEIEHTEDDGEENPLDLELGNISKGGAESAPGAMDCTPRGAMDCTLTTNEPPIRIVKNNTHIAIASASPSKTRAIKMAVCRPDDVDVQTWDDWTAHRKLKRVTVSMTVLAQMRKEALKAKISLQEAMQVSVMRGWIGFKAAWLLEKLSKDETQVQMVKSITGGILHRGTDVKLLN